MENNCRLIDANELWHKTFSCDEVAEVRKFIEQAPTVDAVEVVHGRWEKRTEKNIWGDMQTVYGCTNCKKFSVKGKGITVESDFCPNCGAKMDGGEENATT